MFRHVLVPVDFTVRNRAAIAAARELVDPENGVIQAIHVVQEVPGISPADDPEFYERLEQAAMGSMAELEESLGRGTKHLDVVIGSRAGEILRAARQADLIVMSSHAVQLDQRGAGAGTLSYQIAVAAPCSVLLVK